MRILSTGMTGIVLASAVIVGSGVAQAEEWRMAANPVSSTAKGMVNTEAKGDNTRLDVKVEGLAPAEQANLGSRVYIVWAQSYDQNQAPQNLGALQVNDSKHGEFKTVTALRNFDLFITPEPSPVVAKPTGKELLSVSVSAKAEK